MTSFAELLDAQDSHRNDLAERFAGPPPEPASTPGAGPSEAIGTLDDLPPGFTADEYEILFDRAAHGNEVAIEILEMNGVEPPEASVAKTGDAGRRGGRPASPSWKTDRGFSREVRTHLRAARARNNSRAIDVIGVKPDPTE